MDSDTAVTSKDKRAELEHYRAQIEHKVMSKGLTIPKIITSCAHYFRVSVIGTCNLHCAFCHNEGAPTAFALSTGLADAAFEAASEIGFTRLQITGGEPTMRRDLIQFVSIGSKYFADVGITTNGTRLTPSMITGLASAGLTRVHLSMQLESLVIDNYYSGIPAWLMTVAETCKSSNILLRINLPVVMSAFDSCAQAASDLSANGCALKLFAVLPHRSPVDKADAFRRLLELKDEIDTQGTGRKVDQITVRGYTEPAGFRCPSCPDFQRCTEQSRSLRLGADAVLRPCLASRKWDIPTTTSSIREDIRLATLLSLDYFLL